MSVLRGWISCLHCNAIEACTWLWHCDASESSVVSAGRVYTILRKEEVRHFKELLRKMNNTFVMDHKLTPQLLEAAQPACAHALEVLQAYLAAEGA